jgi:hypothetical protein
MEAASRLSSLTSIGNVQLFRLVAGLNETSDEGGTLDWNLENPTFVWQRNGQHLIALLILNLTFNLQSKEAAPARRIGAIQVGYRVEYALKDESVSDDDIPHFVGISGFMHVWPYLRSEVQALTAKLGLPSLTLPIMVSGQAAAMVTVKHVGEAVSSNDAGEPEVAKTETT